MKTFSTTARRNCQYQYGCSIEEALALNEGFEFSAKGSPMEKYRAQRWMAEKREIAWQFIFPEWKGIWDGSGKWFERGTKAGCYYMARFGDVGPYNVANVFIDRYQFPAPPVDRTALLLERTGCNLTDFESEEQLHLAHQRFLEQRCRSNQRDVPWEMSFADWWSVWKASGMWGARGRDSGASAVMARFGDEGPYRKDNVRIITLAENFSEYWQHSPRRKTA